MHPCAMLPARLLARCTGGYTPISSRRTRSRATSSRLRLGAQQRAVRGLLPLGGAWSKHNPLAGLVAGIARDATVGRSHGLQVACEDNPVPEEEEAAKPKLASVSPHPVTP